MGMGVGASLKNNLLTGQPRQYLLPHEAPSPQQHLFPLAVAASPPPAPAAAGWSVGNKATEDPLIS